MRVFLLCVVAACGGMPPAAPSPTPVPLIVAGPNADVFFARGFTPVFTGSDVAADSPCAKVTHGSELSLIDDCAKAVVDAETDPLDALDHRMSPLVDATRDLPPSTPDLEAMRARVTDAEVTITELRTAVHGWDDKKSRAVARYGDTAQAADELIADIAEMRALFRRGDSMVDTDVANVQRWVDQLPPPDPALAAVRPPVAADLAEYTKGIAGKGALVATLATSLGTFHCELLADKAPMTVANFVGLATGKKPWLDPSSGAVMKGKPFYNGLTFHRVIPQFMIQGGDPTGRGTSGPGYKFADETSPEVTMSPGTLAMANAGPASNGSQFFITEGTPDWLNGKHTIFGRCKEVALVKKIASVPATQDRPNTPVTIKSISFARR